MGGGGKGKEGSPPVSTTYVPEHPLYKQKRGIYTLQLFASLDISQWIVTGMWNLKGRGKFI